MDHRNEGKRFADTLEHLCQHWESQRTAVGVPGKRDAFTIAVSREAGTRGAAIAKEVGRLLGWHVYDDELLECIAKQMRVPTSKLESVDERKRSWLLEVAEAFVTASEKSGSVSLVTEGGYVHHLVKTVRMLGLHGGCVIVGRGAAFILPPETTMRVRLVGPLPERVSTLSRMLGIPEREAAHQVRTLDSERRDFVQDHFFKNPSDPWNYDLVLNVARFSIAHSAELLVDAFGGFQTQAAGKRGVGTTG
jgi:cytidylate kinase